MTCARRSKAVDDEIGARVCRMCTAPLPRQKVGRPAAYCSASCRQAAFRRRRLKSECVAP